MPENKIAPEIVTYLEENLDLDPETLVVNLNQKFSGKCESMNCYCQALTYLKSLFLSTGYEQPPKELHKHLVKCLKNLKEENQEAVSS